jgi:hypothetical protein
VLNASRGRLKAGHSGVVGGGYHRQPLNPAGLSAVLLPCLLMAGLILILLQTIPELSALWHASLKTKPLQPQTNRQVPAGTQGPSALGKLAPVRSIAEAFTPEVQHWSVAIDRWSRSYDLPPKLVMIVMQIESCGDPFAASNSGATGLFQVMPFHFGYGEDMFSPETNAERGLSYLRQSYLNARKRIDLTLAGYNGGLSLIDLPPEFWPEETQRYVYWGTGIWSDLESDPSHSNTLTEWLAAGGARLCLDAQSSQSAR